MAFTATLKRQTVLGNQRVCIFDCTADADGEDNIQIKQLNNVESVAIGIASMDSGCHSLRCNQNSSGVAAMGYVGASGFASGDHFYLTVYGN